MKIAEVVQYYHPGIGGAVRYIRETGKRLCERGHEVTVITTTALDNAGFMSIRHGRRIRPGNDTDLGMKVTRFSPLIIPKIQSSLPLIRPGPVTPQMAKACVAGGYDLIHVHCLPYNHLAWTSLARELTGKPLVLTPDIKQGMNLDRDLVSHIDNASVLAVRTNWEAEYLHSEYRIRNEKTCRIGMGVDVDGFRCPAASPGPGELRKDETRGLILYVGRITPPKGVETLVRALSRIPEAVLVFVGPRNRFLLDCLRRADQDTRRRIILMGAVRDDDLLVSLYRKADVVAYPSRDDSFGAVLLESWAAGKPVVACPIGGPGELVEPGKNGLFARFGDAEDLARRLIYIIDHPKTARKMGLRGRRKAELFDWSLTTDRLESCYRMALDR
jgi:glycosyltransferase involved in cell wall biosynthesis